MKKSNIVILGAGNLATHLAKALVGANHRIIQIFSRQIENANLIACKYNCEAIADLDQLNEEADLFIIALSDSAIYDILGKYDFTNKNVVHTAGSIPISIFNQVKCNYGAFYPFQTFSKKREIDFTNIPICIEANNYQFERFLCNIAEQISNKVLLVNSEKRQIMHLAGVFANNLVNHLYSIAEILLKENEISPETLHELIKETAAKAIEMGSTNAQTGPARRNNIEIIKRHLDLLSSKPDFQRIYKAISEAIVLKYK